VSWVPNTDSCIHGPQHLAPAKTQGNSAKGRNGTCGREETSADRRSLSKSRVVG
jgi:hypothetical protein